MAPKMKMLLKKDLIVEIRHWYHFVAELAIVLFVSLMVLLNPLDNFTGNKIGGHDFNLTAFKPQSLNTLEIFRELACHVHGLRLQYAPSNNFTDLIIDGIKKRLNLIGVIGYDTPDVLNVQFDEESTLAAVVFHDVSGDQVPFNLNISIRFPPFFRTFRPRPKILQLWLTRCTGILELNEKEEDKYLQTDMYLREGFIVLQHMIFMEWLKMLPMQKISGENITINDAPSASEVTALEKFDSLKAKSIRHNMKHFQCIYSDSKHLSDGFLFFAFLYTFLIFVWRFAREREEDVYIHHWILGFPFLSLWISHFIISFLHVLILEIVLATVLRVHYSLDYWLGTMFHVNIWKFSLFLLLFNIALVLTAFVIAALLAKARTAVLFGMVVWLATYAYFSVIINKIAEISSLSLVISFILFFNNSFAYGMRYLKMKDADDRIDFWLLISSMVMNIVVQLLLLDLIQHFKPGRYVYRAPLHMTNWLRRLLINPKRFKKKLLTFNTMLPSSENFESAPFDKQVYVKIENVTTFQRTRNSSMPLLKCINLKIYKGEILVIYGHHASGKTSLLRLMAGIRVPNIGKVKFFDKDIYTNWRDVRHRVAVCMPNNPLFDLLTVHETLLYFMKIKNRKMDKQKFKVEERKWLDVINVLIPNKNALICSLEYEQMRIVVLCCALCCDTKILLFDEPTAHMHERAQKLFWSTLKQERPERAIVIATFSLTEAETIGDRIAMLNKGILLACGRPFFLKTHFLNIYELVVLKKEGANTQAVTQLIRTFIPNITPYYEMADHITYKLPAEKREVYQHMLLHLEEESERLHIMDIRLFTTSLSSVLESLIEPLTHHQVLDENSSIFKTIKVESKRSYSFKQQVSAMIFKKLVHQAPNLIPIAMLVTTIFLMVLISDNAKVLETAERGYNDIIFGFRTLDEKVAIFDKKLLDCRTIKISDIHHTTLATKNAYGRLFHQNSFDCIKEDYMTYNRKLKTHNDFGAATYDKHIWISQTYFHSAALALNLMHNWILMKEKSFEPRFMASITNSPFHLNLTARVYLPEQQQLHLHLPIIIGIAMPVAISIFIFPLIEEKKYNFLIVQIVAGVRMNAYWIATMIWDYCTYVLYTVFFIIGLSIISINHLMAGDKMLIWMLLVMYGISAIPMTYLTSLFFKRSPFRGFIASLILQLLTGLIAYVMYWNILHANDTVYYLLMFFPTFALLHGCSNIYCARMEYLSCKRWCEDCDEDTLCYKMEHCCVDTFFKMEEPGIMEPIFFLILAAVLIWLIIFWVTLLRKERKYTTSRNLRKLRSESHPYDDKEFLKERQRIARADRRDFMHSRFVVDQVESEIPKHGNMLKTISLDLNKFSIYGIYSTRNSGKTHLIKQFIGCDGFAFGDIYIRNYELKYDWDDCYGVMGYGPQGPGAIHNLTPREHLRILCLLRGISNSRIPSIIRELSMALNMNKFMDMRIGSLSVMRQRKVTIAAALLANNKVIILDEPTRGMPGNVQREIWNVLLFARYCGKSIVFTSSNSIECMVLADKVLLFDKGEVLAYGSMQYILSKYTKGLILEIKLRSDGSSFEEAQQILFKDVENLFRFVIWLQDNSELICRTGYCLKFYLPIEHLTFSYLFGAMEKNKRRLNIIDYSITEGSPYDAIDNIRASRLA